jgi:non-heme chloroperoxidase
VIQVIEKTSIGNGVSLEFVHQGKGTGDPVVCLHGITDSWRSFESVLAELPPDIEAFAVSQRGHGDSDRPDSGYEIGQFARDVAAFMRSLEIERAVIVGHSMGAIVAQRFALDFPEMVSGLVLIGSMSNLAGNADVQRFYEEAIRPIGDEIDPELAREFQESTLAQPIDPIMLDMVIAESLKVPARVWKAAFQGLKDVNFIPELAKIEAPVLILWGDLDNFVKRTEQEIVAATLSTSKLVVLPGHGHAVHWESPELIAREIETFVADL